MGGPPGARLRLEVPDYRNLTEWRWVLTENGRAIAEHTVRLEPQSWQFEAFYHLPGRIEGHSFPDSRRHDEARIVAEVSDWIGSQVFGPIAPALADRSPATVRVVLPPGAADLAFRPLELARAGGRPLAAQRVTLVTQLESEQRQILVPVSGRLRVLGLFSLPEGSTALDLRRERQALVKVVRDINATGRCADIRVLQYGVTRESLHGVLSESEGWDIVHISSHGAPGSLVLETPAGQVDPVDTAALAGLLEAARGRLKLVTLSACWSAATTDDEAGRRLGLPVHNQAPHSERAGSPRNTEPGSGALPIELTHRLGCAVLAMRFPVADEFARPFTEELYGLLAARGEPLPRAVGLALKHQADSGRPYSALSLATPALFGAAAAELRLAAPASGSADITEAASAPPKLAGFPPQPERFVGRTGVMARCSATLARKSRLPGVLLHGMPGGGKTACALELAYGHEHAFDTLVWYRAPDEGADITDALTNFMFALERKLPGSPPLDLLAAGAGTIERLPTLTELMRQRRVLIVIDDAESLLTESGFWLDERWGQVIGALTAHPGPGRVILTSRRVPVGLNRLPVESVDALSSAEALLVVRELPHLNALRCGLPPGPGLARRALDVAAGHPKLLELANGQAADPEQLARFLETNESGDYSQVLARWTAAVADQLSPGERALYWFLCCLEEGDRTRLILDENWTPFSQQAGLELRPRDLDQALAAITDRGLVTAPGTAAPERPRAFGIHPLVTAVGRTQAGRGFRAVVDAVLAAYWQGEYKGAAGNTGITKHTTIRGQVSAGLSAVPYLLRREQWAGAAHLLDRAFARNPSRKNAVTMWPASEQIVARYPRARLTQASLLEVIRPGAGEAVMRSYLKDASESGDYDEAYAAAGRLVSLYLKNGRPDNAQSFLGQATGYARYLRLGPWAQVASEVQQLQVQTSMGLNHYRILIQVEQLRRRMRSLPPPPRTGEEDEVMPWSITEELLSIPVSLGPERGLWRISLKFVAKLTRSMDDRHAPGTEIAAARLNACRPLVKLNRTHEALNLVMDLKRTFEQAQDDYHLGKTLSGLAQVEAARGRGVAAVDLQRAALRYDYLAGNAGDIAAGYHELGNLHFRYYQEPTWSFRYLLAAVLICELAGVGTKHLADSMADLLLESSTVIIPPGNVAELVRAIGDIEGTDPADLISSLSPDPETAEQTLRDLIEQIITAIPLR